MKLTITKFDAVLALFFASAFLLAINPVQACESSCQNGISKAFSDAYSKEIDKIFSKYVTDLTDSSSLFDGVKVHTKLKIKIKEAISTAVTNQKNNFEGSLADLAKNSIFNEKPQFKGQCQHPLRVKQPPAGVNWTLTDCKNQDYICGNPPAICHFMNQIVKPRIVKNINTDFKSLVSSNKFSGTIKEGIKSAAISQGLSGNDLDTVVNGVSSNADDTLPGFQNDFVAGFCSAIKGKKDKTTCDKYDDNIKSLLLSFP